jgi:type II secretory pathway component GspD/PulD (secretin)
MRATVWSLSTLFLFAASAQAASAIQVSGGQVSASYDKTPVRQVLHELADALHVQVRMSPKVKGKVSASVKQAEPERAIKTLLKGFNVAMVWADGHRFMKEIVVLPAGSKADAASKTELIAPAARKPSRMATSVMAQRRAMQQGPQVQTKARLAKRMRLLGDRIGSSVRELHKLKQQRQAAQKKAIEKAKADKSSHASVQAGPSKQEQRLMKRIENDRRQLARLRQQQQTAPRMSGSQYMAMQHGLITPEQFVSGRARPAGVPHRPQH